MGLSQGLMHPLCPTGIFYGSGQYSRSSSASPQLDPTTRSGSRKDSPSRKPDKTVSDETLLHTDAVAVGSGRARKWGFSEHFAGRATILFGKNSYLAYIGFINMGISLDHGGV